MNDTSEKILISVKNKDNVLIHCPGGTGKTHLLKIIAKECLKNKRKVACVAPTGVAALGLSFEHEGNNISGSTIHSWSGIGLGDASAEKLLEKVLKWPGSRAKWMTADILIIDEISMMGANLFDKLDYIGRRVRRISKPFGGIQLILGGDFLQLPPVNEKWAFKSSVWQELELKSFSLNEPQRYPDVDWFHLLLRVRKAEHTNEDISFLKTRVDAYEKWKEETTSSSETLIKPTVLYSRKADVDLENDIELNKLPSSKEVIFKAVDVFESINSHAKKEYYMKTLDDAIPKVITLRIGSQVMLKANLDQEEGYVNGSRGVVIDLTQNSAKIKWFSGQITDVAPHLWVQEDKDGKMSRSQIPLILAWALTVHKCQGSTLDYAICNLGPSVFCPGQAYVALSRVRSSQGLLLEEFYPKVIQTDQDALNFTKKIEKETLKKEDIPLAKKSSQNDEIQQIKYVMKFVKNPNSKKRPKKESAIAPFGDYDFDELFSTLKSWRDQLAKESGSPPYLILNNSSLVDIAFYKPKTEEELETIKGLGHQKIEAYGSEILSITKSSVETKRRLPKNNA